MKSYLSLKIIGLILFLSFNPSKFSAQSSDKKAILIAEKVVKAMGGIENYDNTNFIQWDFGKRTLFWNKWTGDVRIESPDKNLVILVNINSGNGKAYENSNLITEGEKTKKTLKQGKKMWINDSYWLVMPWKLQDPGVNLSYIKTEKLPNENTADILQLTFNNVGVTPKNKYYVFVDQTDSLIKQWSFFSDFEDASPKFTRPWDNYQKTGDILLSFDRSEFGPKNVIVKQDFNAKLFTELKYE